MVIKMSEKGNIITDVKLDKYFDVTGRAIKKVKLVGGKREVDFTSSAKDFLNMAQCYYYDALHFKKKGDIVNAFAALSYAHGWLDAGARLGLFDVDGDNVLFTVD